MITEIKKTREMTPRMFLNLAIKNTKYSSDGFIAAYRSFLETGELAAQVSPILAKIDSKEVLPTPGLEAIKNIVFSHVLSKLEDTIKPIKSDRIEKAYIATIFTSEGTVATTLDENKEEKELSSSFEHSQEAERWCQRKLYEGAPDWHGEITWTKIHTRSGIPMVTRVERASAIYALTPRKRSPFMHYNKAGSGPLGPQMKVGQTHANFSHG